MHASLISPTKKVDTQCLFTEHVADIALAVDGQGRIVYANAGAYARLAGPPQGLVGVPILRHVPRASHGWVRESILRAEQGLMTEAILHIQDVTGKQMKVLVRVFMDCESQNTWLLGVDLEKVTRLEDKTENRVAQLANLMPGALANREFAMHYQPIVDRAGAIKGCEALMRWQIASGEWISPLAFIPAAEDSGFILELGLFALDEALVQLSKFDQVGLPDLYVSVNVSPLQLTHDDFEATVLAYLAKHGIKPHRLLLEVTEAVALVSPDSARAVLGRLSEVGVRVALDDFGSGYAGMSHLKTLPVSCVKVDRLFTQGYEDNETSKIILDTLVEMAGRLNLLTVAEGIETPQQASAIAATNVDLFQGFLFGRPMPAEDLLLAFKQPRSCQ